jgi:uncharacterized protein YrrD
MQFREDATVFSANGDRIGELERVVIEPETKEVSHVVVRKGILFTEDKIVPVNLIASAEEDGITLREDADDLEALPDFYEQHFVPVEEGEFMGGLPPYDYPNPLYWYPPAYGVPYGAPQEYLPEERTLYAEETAENVPEGAVALKEGARVISADGDHVGDIDAVLTDPLADRATHFVISEGLLLKGRKLIPIAWVKIVYQDEVHLRVRSSQIEELQPYAEE